jgi:hypothetical protein
LTATLNIPAIIAASWRASLALALLTAAAGAQAGAVLPIPTAHPAIVVALDSIRSWNEWTLQQQISLNEIEAPPFKEEKRAAEFKRRLESLGLSNVRIDAEGNVIGVRRGSGAGPTIVLSGHLDTVFPEGTDVRVTRDGGRLAAPGIGDDARGLAVVLAVLRAMQEARISTKEPFFLLAPLGKRARVTCAECGTSSTRNTKTASTTSFLLTVRSSPLQMRRSAATDTGCRTLGLAVTVMVPLECRIPFTRLAEQ